MNSTLPSKQYASRRLRELIYENYGRQEDFAIDFGIDIRTLSRYLNNGINNLDLIDEFALFFNVERKTFFY